VRGALVSSHQLSVLQRTATVQIGSDAGRAESVITHRHRNAEVRTDAGEGRYQQADQCESAQAGLKWHFRWRSRLKPVGLTFLIYRHNLSDQFCHLSVWQQSPM
jgi:hypothetical protein